MDIDKLLEGVQKPGRYTGLEWNSVRKDWAKETVKVLLAFPDVYEIGMSYLGGKILYGIINGRADALCERVFAPWGDFEDALRKAGVGLFSLESRKPIGSFDVIGFHLTYELTYTNILNILDLGRIPLRSSERSDDHPIVLGGGPACFNPEPMAEFIDAFVIGDGEEIFGEIIEAFKRMGPKERRPRGDILKELSLIKGIYVPAYYNVRYNADGTIGGMTSLKPEAPARISRRTIASLDAAFYPVNQIVPNIQVIHDRLVIEVMRGCIHACGFCQASAIYRPCRERSVGRILEIAEEAYRSTGYDEISLLSLSSGDYSRVIELVEELNKRFSGRSVSISLPSLRIEDAAKDLPEVISRVKKSGLTFAPEVATDSLRRLINKGIDIDKLFYAALESFKKGWRRVKLYFMIGLPGENDADVEGICALADKLSILRREVDGRPAEIAVSVNAFIPKPHTPMERKPMNGVGQLEEKARLLKAARKSRNVELSIHPIGMSLLEAAISRGDRRVWRAIHEAWRAGSRLDGWQDKFDLGRWEEAFRAAGLDISFYACRERNDNEILPWSHIG